MIDELKQIAIFAKTVEHGSFRAAGQALRLSPSVVSHHVAQLEKQLGTPLLYRSTRKLSLTSDGKKLLTAANAMLEAAELGFKNISREGNNLSGSLRLTVPALMTHTDLLRRIAFFSNSHSEVKVSIDSSDHRQDIIAEGFDVAIVPGPLKNSSLLTEKLYHIRRKLVTSPAYAKSQKKPESPADLTTWRWLEQCPVIHQRTEFSSARQKVSISKRRVQISVNSSHALLELVIAGGGLAVLPGFIVEPHLHEGHLQVVLEDWEIEPIELYACWAPNATSNGTAERFIQFLSDNIAVTDM